MTDVRLDPVAPPEREAKRNARRERSMVPKAEFRSYYGLPVLNQPTWKAQEIAGYLFLGGLAGASSTLGAAATFTGRPRLARAAKLGALGALGLSTVALIKDLGRPSRFYNMLRVFKVTSPMSVGSWLLATYGGPVAVAAACDVTGIAPGLGAVATASAGVLGPAVATYTGALIADTAVPLWHDAHKEMPVLFAGSAASAAGGFGMLTSPVAEAAPARRAALAGTAVELAMTRKLKAQPAGELLDRGRAGTLMRTAEVLGAAGAVLGFTLGRRSRPAAMAAGAALLASSACTRFGIFHAGVASAQDPKYVVQPQRERRQVSSGGGAEGVVPPGA